ncbi:MAG: hypothetical protein WC683_17425 [bacterium]
MRRINIGYKGVPINLALKGDFIYCLGASGVVTVVDSEGEEHTLTKGATAGDLKPYNSLTITSDINPDTIQLIVGFGWYEDPHTFPGGSTELPDYVYMTTLSTDPQGVLDGGGDKTLLHCRGDGSISGGQNLNAAPAAVQFNLGDFAGSSTPNLPAFSAVYMCIEVKGMTGGVLSLYGRVWKGERQILLPVLDQYGVADTINADGIYWVLLLGCEYWDLDASMFAGAGAQLYGHFIYTQPVWAP